MGKHLLTSLQTKQANTTYQLICLACLCVGLSNCWLVCLLACLLLACLFVGLSVCWFVSKKYKVEPIGIHFLKDIT